MSLRRIFAIVIRHLYLYPRTLERIFDTLGWPLLGLFVWGFTSNYLQQNSTFGFSFTSLFVGGLFLWTIFSFVQVQISLNFLDEAWNKNLINIFSTPLTSVEFQIAVIILGLIKLLPTLLAMTVGALLLYQFNFITTFNFYIPILLFSLLISGWAFGFFINGLILKFGYSISQFAWSLTAIIQPFVCVFYPLDSLPVWAQKIAVIFPMTYIFEEMRRLMFKGYVDWNNLMISFILNGIYLTVSVFFFLRMFEKAREDGRLIKLN